MPGRCTAAVLGLLLALASGSVAAAGEEGVLGRLAVSPAAFEPAAGETATISFHSERPGQAFVRLFGPDWHQVRELEVEGIEPGEPATVTWDGRDDAGDLVPAEAYFPLVDFVDQQGGAHVLDASLAPRARSVLLEDLHYHADTGRIAYTLAEPARVTLHAGIDDGGPLLATLVAELPRVAGAHEEPWDGRDAAGVVDIASQPRFRLFADGVGLWRPSIIVRGGDDRRYAAYRRETESPHVKPRLRLEDYGGTPAALPRPLDITPEPRFGIAVPGAREGGGLPVVSGRVGVEVSLDDEVRIPVIERRFEIVLFVDLEFVTEVEEGRSPATIIWDSTGLPDGEHLLTVNVATLPGQMSSASVRVRVDNSP